MASDRQTIPLTERDAWKALKTHAEEIRATTISELFVKDPARANRMTLDSVGLHLDYSKNRVTDTTLSLLTKLAEECGLQQRTEAMFTGEKINITENRAVLHVALRGPRWREDRA